MALKIWLIRKIEELELDVKYLNALLIMLQHVEQATDYKNSDSDSDDDSNSDSKTKERDSEDSIRTSDIKELTDSDDDDYEIRKAEILSKIRELKNKKF
jgi:hypothetical protein